MANTKSAIKRMKQAESRRVKNRAIRTRVRGALKAARTALATQPTEASAAVLDAVRALDRAVTKGILHRNTVARKKSALARKLHASS